MKVYACYLKVQKVEHWEIVSDDVEFITDSLLKANCWKMKSEGVSQNGVYINTRYFKEFELQ